MWSVNRALWRKKLITVQHRTHLAALKTAWSPTQKGTCIILLLHCLKRFWFIFKQSTTPSKQTNFKLSHRRRVSSSLKMLPTKLHCCWCFKLYEKQTIAVWYLVQQKGNVVLWHQVHCGLSSIKAKIDKMGPFISIRGFGFHGCHGGLYQREVLKTWHLRFFLHQYTPEAHSLCMSYIMRPLFVYSWPPMAF